MELRQYFNTVRKWLWLIVLATAVAALASFIATRQQPPIYSSKTTLIVGSTIENPNPSGNDIWLGQQLAQTYAELAKRDVIKRSAMEALGLSWLPQYSVTLVPNTQLLEINVVDASPERAQAVAQEVARQLIEQSPSAPELEQRDRQVFVNKQLQELEANIDATRARVEELQGQLANMFSARQIADTQTQIAALEQKQAGYQANYASLLSFVSGGANSIRVVEPASLPTAPIGPNKSLTILLAAAIGMLLALGAAFLLDYLDDTIKTPEDVQAATHLATLGVIARIEGETAAEKLVTFSQPKSPNAEAYRILRTNLLFSAVDNPPRTLLVTSSSPSEGKSTTLANLGVVMAQQGQRVVLVDSDLRRPTLHRLFQAPNATGLTSALLHEQPSAVPFLQPTKVENLSLLTTGPLPPNPAELLGSARFGELLRDLQAHADVILLDSPPALAVTDAPVLARQVDGVLLVVDAGATRRQWAANAQETLSKVGAKVLGVGLNRLKPGSSSYYYYYHYYYSSEEGGDASGGKRRRKPRGLGRWLPRLS
jgi:non-specific protein-tyrosine kinase